MSANQDSGQEDEEESEDEESERGENDSERGRDGSEERREDECSREEVRKEDVVQVESRVSFHVDGGRDGRIMVLGGCHVQIVPSHEDGGHFPLRVGGEPVMVDQRVRSEDDLVGRVCPGSEDESAVLGVEGIEIQIHVTGRCEPCIWIPHHMPCCIHSYPDRTVDAVETPPSSR